MPRADYRRFREHWSRAIGGPNDADSLDLRLHADRLDGKQKRSYRARLSTLPDGTYVVAGGAPHLIWRGNLCRWSDSGYVERAPLPGSTEIEVLTPRAIVNVLAAGFEPLVHPSADHSVSTGSFDGRS